VRRDFPRTGHECRVASGSDRERGPGNSSGSASVRPQLRRLEHVAAGPPDASGTWHSPGLTGPCSFPAGRRFFSGRRARKGPGGTVGHPPPGAGTTPPPAPVARSAGARGFRGVRGRMAPCRPNRQGAPLAPSVGRAGAVGRRRCRWREGGRAGLGDSISAGVCPARPGRMGEVRAMQVGWGGLRTSGMPSRGLVAGRQEGMDSSMAVRRTLPWP
jgi:hypothetical protein